MPDNSENARLKEALRVLCNCIFDYDNNSHDILTVARRADRLLQEIDEKEAATASMKEYLEKGGYSLDDIKTELGLK